jgi:hypothetical protein
MFCGVPSRRAAEHIPEIVDEVGLVIPAEPDCQIGEFGVGSASIASAACGNR